MDRWRSEEDLSDLSKIYAIRMAIAKPEAIIRKITSRPAFQKRWRVIRRGAVMDELIPYLLPG